VHHSLAYLLNTFCVLSGAPVLTIYPRNNSQFEIPTTSQLHPTNTHSTSTPSVGATLPIPMPICISCRYPVKTLYTSYSKADDRALGKGVRLTQCPRCKRFADKYVEHDFVVLFIDLVLIKPEVCCDWAEDARSGMDGGVGV
jgi:hypothetical protein